jgi:hypothetical protein
MGPSSGSGRVPGGDPGVICVVDTLTTLGWSFFASVTKSGELFDGAEPLFDKNPSEPSVFLPEQPNPIPVSKNSMKTIMALRIFLPFQGKKKTHSSLCRPTRQWRFFSFEKFF